MRREGQKITTEQAWNKDPELLSPSVSALSPVSVKMVRRGAQSNPQDQNPPGMGSEEREGPDSCGSK
jgi:hypothetical protein